MPSSEVSIGENVAAVNGSVRRIDNVLEYLTSAGVREQQLREIQKYKALAAVSEIIIYQE